MPPDLQIERAEHDGLPRVDALRVVWERMLARVDNQLRPSERLATQLLEGDVSRATVDEATAILEEASAWLADLGMVAAARGARALRDHIEAIDVDLVGRNVGAAVVAAGLIEGVRSSVEAVGASGMIAASVGDRLLVVGEPSLMLDNAIWCAAAAGFAVEHSDGLENWPGDSDSILVIDQAGRSLAATLLACRSAQEGARDVPLIVVTDRLSVRDRAELALHATSLLGATLRTAEVIDEIRRHVHAVRRPRELAVRGLGAENYLPGLQARGVDAWTAENDLDLLTGLEAGRATGVLLLPAEDNDAIVRLLRCQPGTRQLTIVEVLADGREEAAAAGVDATIESVDVVVARAGQLAELLRQRTDLDIDVSGMRRVGGVPWASASFLAERALLAAHRTGAVVSVCVIQYGPDEESASVDGVQEALMREFRTDDIVARNGERENILVLGGVGAQVTHARFEGIVERASTAHSRVGVAEFPHDAQSLDELIDAARSGIDRSSQAENGPRVVTADWHPDRRRSADVIVADPDPAAARVVARSLQRVGVSVDHVTDGQVLLERLRDVTLEPPKLLILEFDLLSVDGLTILRRLSDRAALRRLDVVMLSSRTRESDVRQAYDLGVADVIEKPFSPGILVRRLLRILEVES